MALTKRIALEMQTLRPVDSRGDDNLSEQIEITIGIVGKCGLANFSGGSWGGDHV